MIMMFQSGFYIGPSDLQVSALGPFQLETEFSGRGPYEYIGTVSGLDFWAMQQASSLKGPLKV